jgi:mono/diheme cytochrome c family protein
MVSSSQKVFVGSFFPSVIALGSLGFAALFYSCGSKSSDDPVAKATATAAANLDCNSSLKFAEVEPLLSTGSGKCVSCHGVTGGSKNVNLADASAPTKAAIANVKTNQAAMLEAIARSSVPMPPSPAGWKDTEDGKKVISYLSCATLN